MWFLGGGFEIRVWGGNVGVSGVRSKGGGFLLFLLFYRMAPMHAIHIVGRCLRLVSVYAAYHYVIARGVSLTFFVFVCLLGSAAVFSALQRPWRGRPLPNSLVL